MQQTEGAEGGLSVVEKRALLDVGDQAGGKNVFIVENVSPLSAEEALLELRDQLR